MAADKEVLIDLGLEHSVLTKNKGKIPPENFPKILAAVTNVDYSNKTKVDVASAFALWMKSAPGNGPQAFHLLGDIFDTIATLVIQPDDDQEGEDYRGVQCCAHSLIDGIGTATMFDPTQKYASMACPLAYSVLEKLTKTTLTLDDEGAYVKKCAATERKNTVYALFRCVPYTGTVRVPCALAVIAHFLTGDFPSSVKQAAKQAMQSMANTNKECMQDGGMEIMAIVATGEHDELIFNFLSMPELYTRNPESIHQHLEMLLTRFNWMQICSLINNVATKHPAQLVPHATALLAKLREVPAMGAITIGCLKEVAKVDPDVVYPLLDGIIEAAKSVPSSSYAVAGCIGAVGRSKTRPNAADEMLDRMITCLKTCEAAYLSAVLAELCDLKESLSSRETLAPHMEYISSLNDKASVQVRILEDFFAGRSLESLEIRVDAVELKISELNNKVAESCSNFEEVMAYVDANIADMKDFVGDVVKKLPAPKRLEVVGTIRKTLILHFECVHTGYEFPIESKEWSKWVKMGFSLAKAGKAIFDIGTGNPLGLLSTGIDCVKGIYDAYKTNDDDEFNTYITNPFLTSTEQDQLIEKLRDQGFFEKMDYDNQAPGWYLLNPEEDGTPPGGEHGSVTKVRSKGGGVKEAILSNMDLIEGAVYGAVPELEMISTVAQGAAAIQEAVTTSDSAEETKSPIAAGSSPAGAGSGSSGKAGAVGSRAAQMRQQMAGSGKVDLSVVDGKVAGAEQMVAIEAKINSLQGEVNSMKQEIADLQTTVARHEAGAGGCNCTIS